MIIKMGCCQHSNGIIKPGPIKRPSLLSGLKEKLSEITENLLKEYEDHLLQRVTPDQPRTLAEFSQISSKTMEKVTKEYDEETKDLAKNLLYISQIKFYKHYLSSKCKAKEGLLSNENSLNSFRYIFKLIETLLNKIEQGIIDDKQSVEAFTKLAKGAYMIKGLQIYHNLLGVNSNERKKLLKALQENENSRLIDDRNQLVGLYKDSLIPGTQMMKEFEENEDLKRENSLKADSFYNETEHEFLNLNEQRIRRLSASYSKRRIKYESQEECA
jgi:hypothetical protein